MSCDASGRADNKERGKIYFYDKKKEWKLKNKTKSKDERIESDVP